MEHLDIPHIFFHYYLLKRKQKIWERGAACLWPLVCPADKHPVDSSRNEAGTVNRSITAAYSLLFHSVWLTVRATLLSRCFVFTLFCYHNFLYFLSFFHSYLINPFTIYSSIHPSIHPSSIIHLSFYPFIPNDDFLCTRFCAIHWLRRENDFCPPILWERHM